MKVTGGKLIVRATSRVHDTTTTWDKISGTVDATPDAIEQAKATFEVDMTSFDAGDWLRNRKLRKDFDMEGHPRATFALTRVSDVQRDGSSFVATAEGTLTWRGKQVVLVLKGRGTLDDKTVSATATFQLDIKKLGLTAPSFLMIKMSDEVEVEVTVRGAA